MKLPPRTTNRLSRLAPFATLLVLVALSWALPNRVRIDGRSLDRKAEVAAAMAAVPFFIGDWIGQDRPVPAEAQKLLRPNAIFSRVYEKPGGAWAHVLIVHCSDARDMIGHYPPICYPSAGWLEDSSDEPKRVVLNLDEADLPVHVYRFRRMQDQGRELSIRIFNAFVLPDGTVTQDISDINRQSERLAVSAQGVAQLQVLTSASADGTDAKETATELLNGMRELMKALRVGQGASRDI